MLNIDFVAWYLRFADKKLMNLCRYVALDQNWHPEIENELPTMVSLESDLFHWVPELFRSFQDLSGLHEFPGVEVL